jgi:hypothetical protein
VRRPVRLGRASGSAGDRLPGRRAGYVAAGGVRLSPPSAYLLHPRLERPESAVRVVLVSAPAGRTFRSLAAGRRSRSWRPTRPVTGGTVVTGRQHGTRLIPPARPCPLSYACGSGGVPGGGCGLGEGSGLGAGSGRSGPGGSDGGAGTSGVGSGGSGCEGSLMSTSTLAGSAEYPVVSKVMRAALQRFLAGRRLPRRCGRRACDCAERRCRLSARTDARTGLSPEPAFRCSWPQRRHRLLAGSFHRHGSLQSRVVDS